MRIRIRIRILAILAYRKRILYWLEAVFEYVSYTDSSTVNVDSLVSVYAYEP